MASIDPSSASVSTWREKIVETGKKGFSQISSSVSVITTKIKAAGIAVKAAGISVVAAIRGIEVDPLKESLGIFNDWFTWFLASIFALKFADTGKPFFSANNSILMALFLTRFMSSLTALLATLFQMHQKNIAPLVLMLVLESGASVLAASLFSRPVLWISVTLWLCIFVLFVYCCWPELKDLISTRQEIVENQNQEGLPIVTLPFTAEESIMTCAT